MWKRFKQFVMGLVLTPIGSALDRRIVRWTGWSLISAVFAWALGIPYQPTLGLRTIGRRTGRLRMAVLPYKEFDGAYYLVGSNGGAPRHPAWAVNLMTHPNAWIWVQRRQIPVHAELLEGEERREIFERISQGRGPYVRYQKMASPRELPVLRLTPFALRSGSSAHTAPE